MEINCAYRYELKPKKNQLGLLSKSAGCSRFAYNWGLAGRIKLYEESGGRTDAIKQHKELNKLKATDFPWMYEVSKCAPQEALRDLDRAFKNFFKGLKEGRNVGFPKFKKKGIHDSFRLTGSIVVKEKSIKLPRLGEIKLKEKTKVKGKILSATVSREADRWFVSLTVVKEIEEPEPIENGNVAAIDVGLNNFAVFVDGRKLDAPRPLKKYLKNLERKSRQHSKKQIGSRNRKKSAIKLARLHKKIRDIRRDFLHKLTTELAKTKQEIVIEDLNLAGMVKNKKLSRHIEDSGFGEFRRMLEYKTKWYGSMLTLAPRFAPSSKLCSECGYKMEEMPLSIREWKCPQCGTFHDRDVNAAKNLLKYSVTLHNN